MLYLVQNSIYNLVSLPGLAWSGLAREENVWAVFSGLQKQVEFPPGLMTGSLSFHHLAPAFFMMTGGFSQQ